MDVSEIYTSNVDIGMWRLLISRSCRPIRRCLGSIIRDVGNKIRRTDTISNRAIYERSNAKKGSIFFFPLTPGCDPPRHLLGIKNAHRGELRLGDEILFEQPANTGPAARQEEPVKLDRGLVHSFHHEGATVTCTYRNHPG